MGETYMGGGAPGEEDRHLPHVRSTPELSSVYVPLDTEQVISEVPSNFLAVVATMDK